MEDSTEDSIEEKLDFAVRCKVLEDSIVQLLCDKNVSDRVICAVLCSILGQLSASVDNVEEGLKQVNELIGKIARKQ